MMLNEIPHVVVGVMPAGFAFPGERVVWVPLAYRNSFSATTTEGRRNNAYVRVLARLRQGVSIEAARDDLGAAAQRLEERFPETNRGVRFTPVPRQEDLVGDVRTLLLLLLGAVGLVLVIASANVASLLLRASLEPARGDCRPRRRLAPAAAASCASSSPNRSCLVSGATFLGSSSRSG